MRRLLLLLPLVLAACSSPVTLTYAPTTRPTPAEPPAPIASVSATDQRNEPDPSWIGAIRGGYGNSLKALHLAGPLADSVASAFRMALTQRGLLSPAATAPFDLKAAITSFQGNQIVRREAVIAVAIDLTDHAGRSRYHDTAEVTLTEGNSLLDNGILADPAKLAGTLQTAFTQAIDQLLDRPAFRAALSPQGPPTT